MSAGTEWSIEPTAGGFVYRSQKISLSLPLPALRGAHQIVNAATAVACVEQCGDIVIGEKDIAAGISSARWPGRFEPLPDGSLRHHLPSDWEIWIDAGHNAAAGEALAVELRQINADRPRPLHIIFGMLDDKDPAAFLSPLAILAASVTAVPLPNEPRSHDPRASAEALTSAGVVTGWAPSLDTAFDALAASPGGARVLICGSHVLAGAALRGDARPL